MFGNAGSIVAHVTWIDKEAPTATVLYSTTGLTNQDVVASLTLVSDDVEPANIPAPITFTGNGTAEFVITDRAGNSTTISATVNNIDKVLPVITVNADADMNIELGATYTEA